MGKVSELSQLIEELNRCGNTLIGISEDLGLPIPVKIKTVLEQLHDRAESEEK